MPNPDMSVNTRSWLAKHRGRLVGALSGILGGLLVTYVIAWYFRGVQADEYADRVIAALDLRVSSREAGREPHVPLVRLFFMRNDMSGFKEHFPYMPQDKVDAILSRLRMLESLVRAERRNHGPAQPEGAVDLLRALMGSVPLDP